MDRVGLLFVLFGQALALVVSGGGISLLKGLSCPISPKERTNRTRDRDRIRSVSGKIVVSLSRLFKENETKEAVINITCSILSRLGRFYLLSQRTIFFPTAEWVVCERRDFFSTTLFFDSISTVLPLSSIYYHIHIKNGRHQEAEKCDLRRRYS